MLLLVFIKSTLAWLVSVESAQLLWFTSTNRGNFFERRTPRASVVNQAEIGSWTGHCVAPQTPAVPNGDSTGDAKFCNDLKMRNIGVTLSKADPA